MTGKRDVRQRLLDATIGLISRGGPMAATPAAIAERAGAAKMSLYRHFAGKDELVAEALKNQIPRQRALVLGEPVLGPRERLLDVFDRQAAWADRAGGQYRGCPYVRAWLQLDGSQHPAAPVIVTHKDDILRGLTAILRDAGLPDPEQTAPVIAMLLDGAIIHAVIRGNGEPFRQARQAVADLLADRMEGPGQHAPD